MSLFALPPIHVRAMHVNSRLDQTFRDADLELQLAIDNPQREDAAGLAVSLELLGPGGRPSPSRSETLTRLVVQASRLHRMQPGRPHHKAFCSGPLYVPTCRRSHRAGGRRRLSHE